MLRKIGYFDGICCTRIFFKRQQMEHLGFDPRLDLKDGEIGGDDWLMTLRRYQSTTTSRWWFQIFFNVHLGK